MPSANGDAMNGNPTLQPTLNPEYQNYTVVSRQVFWSNSTWPVVNSPYLITGIVGIASGVMLTIEAGVEVVCKSPSVCIMLKGQLLANGTSSLPVTFRCYDSSCSNVNSFIRVLGGADNNAVNLQYVDIQGTEYDADADSCARTSYSWGYSYVAVI